MDQEGTINGPNFFQHGPKMDQTGPTNYQKWTDNGPNIDQTWTIMDQQFI